MKLSTAKKIIHLKVFVLAALNLTIIFSHNFDK